MPKIQRYALPSSHRFRDRTAEADCPFDGVYAKTVTGYLRWMKAQIQKMVEKGEAPTTVWPISPNYWGGEARILKLLSQRPEMDDYDHLSWTVALDRIELGPLRAEFSWVPKSVRFQTDLDQDAGGAGEPRVLWVAITWDCHITLTATSKRRKAFDGAVWETEDVEKTTVVVPYEENFSYIQAVAHDLSWDWCDG